MLSTIFTVAFGTGLAGAIAIRGSGCDLHFTVDGAISGPVGQIESGQVRAGGGVGSTTFTFQDGGLHDPHGRGCWWTREYLLKLHENFVTDMNSPYWRLAM